MSNAAQSKELLLRYVKARIPFIVIQTDERRRALDIVSSVAEALSQMIFCHTKSKGTFDLASGQVIDDDGSIYGAFQTIRDQMNHRSGMVFVLTESGDLSDETNEAKEVYDLVQTAVDNSTCIISITPKDVWPQLQQMGLAIALDRPDEDEARQIIEEMIGEYRSSIPIEWDAEDVREAATTLAGVSKIEIENTIASLLAAGKVTKDDLYEMRRSKDRLFSNIAGLEKIPVSQTDGQVGGLAALRSWCDEKRELLTPEKRDMLLEMGLRPPRGILLVGVPGCGKSLSAKSIAANWRLPLYRLDFATVQGSYVGQTERQLKEAFAMAEAVSPCILWIDEIEKGLAGARGAGNDGGVSTRMVGQFLFWLQECTKTVFVVATANDVSKLPPELLRRGRFDEIFFVDLPTSEERRDIMALYMRKYLKVSFAGPFADELVEATESFSGADLESTIRDIAYKRVSDPGIALTEDFIRRAFGNVIPLSQTSPEQIEAIQAWGRERAVPASGRPIGEGRIRRDAAPRIREVLL